MTDAPITEAHRRAALDTYCASFPDDKELRRLAEKGVGPFGRLLNSFAQLIANERRDADLAGRIAGLREGFSIGGAGHLSAEEVRAILDARIADLEAGR